MSKLQLYFHQFKTTSAQPDVPELVMLHGWGLHSGVWDPVMAALLEHFSITLIDLPGFGRSPVPGGDYNLDYLVEHVVAVAPQRAIWLGWSLGGLVAMKIAAEQPQRVSGLVAVATNPQFCRAEDWPAAMPGALLDDFIGVFDEDWEGTLIRFLALQCKDSATIKADIRQLRDMLYFHGLPAKQALRKGLEILRVSDLRIELSKIQRPSLYLLGERDALIPQALAKQIPGIQPQATVASITGASHVPFLSHPEAFLAALMRFFKEQELVSR